jgi:hypothetical protein
VDTSLRYGKRYTLEGYSSKERTRGGKGNYMFHWGNKRQADENNVPDWNDQVKFFTKFVKKRRLLSI